MKDNKYLAWTSFVLFGLSVGILLISLLFSSAFSSINVNPGFLIFMIGAFSLLAMIMGFLSFKAPQAKAGGIGGLVLLLLVLFITPARRETSFVQPQPEGSTQEQAGQTGIAEIDAIIATVLAGDPQAQLQLLYFTEIACTRAEGLGGPPKCREGEAEGTIVEAFPFLSSEGHHARRDEMNDWSGIQASQVYAVYRVSDQVYSDEAYPAGEYAIVFLVEDRTEPVIAHVIDGQIVRLDDFLGSPEEIDLDQVASEIILAPQK